MTVEVEWKWKGSHATIIALNKRDTRQEEKEDWYSSGEQHLTSQLLPFPIHSLEWPFPDDAPPGYMR